MRHARLRPEVSDSEKAQKLDRGRMLALFRPYRARLSAVLVLILISAGLGMVSPFLLRAVLDQAIPEQNTQLLAILVGGMIAIALATGALGVAQTLYSNTVGQRVMHDLRAAVYRHLQRLSLSFFTRTRTGEIQSRIANDIGGVQNVVTSTATSIVSNVTTVLAATAAMFLLDWRLAIFSLGLLPFFVWLTRRVGNERRRITSVRQTQMADMSALVEESLSVSGILLGKTMGRSAELAERFEHESGELADLEVRSRMAGRWRMASVQIAFAAMPALVYLFAGLSIAGGGDHDHDRHPGRLHHPADPALLPDPVAPRRRRRGAELAGALRARLRVPRPAGRGHRARGRAADPRRTRSAARLPSRRSASATSADGARTAHDIDLEVPAGDTLGDRRRDRLGQDDARLPASPASTTPPRAG